MAEAHEDLLTLAVDTATEKRSVAIFRGERRLSLCTNDSFGNGSANILSDIEQALELASVNIGEIGLFAAAVGAGSFTGLRAGIATIKGFALTLGKPLVGVQTLHAVAHAARPSARLVALIPAGRGEVFAQIFNAGEESENIKDEEPAHLTPVRLLEKVQRLGGGIKWAGGGAHKFIELIRDGAIASGLEFKMASVASYIAGEKEWVIAPVCEALAESVARLARLKYLKGETESADGLRAIYVRPSDAELKGQCHAQG